MKYYLNKLLLRFLQLLVRIKRGVVWVGKEAVWPAIVWLGKGYRSTVGLALYRALFRLGKKLEVLRVYKLGRAVDFIGKRGTLQIALFIVVFTVMLPHSKLYTRDPTHIAGQNTVLYKLVGPGEEFFDIEEVTDVFLPELDNRLGWRQGAVSVDTPGSVGTEIVRAPQDISSISAGGTAVTKPTILPGVQLPTVDAVTGVPSLGRTKVLYYEVQPGDVVGTIAQKYGISVATILWSNNLSARSYIRPGDTLKILPENGVAHKVKRGDTVIKIAKIYGVEIASVVQKNKLKNDGSDIIIGEELFIPGGVMPRSQRFTPPTRRYSTLSSVAAPPPSAAAPAGSGYLWPTSARRITQYFGWRHTGVDIGDKIGTPIYATRSGVAIKSQCGWNGGYGCYIILDHGGGVHTVYAHNSQLYVTVGQQVNQGQTIAAMGSTGRSTGSHLHFEIRQNGHRLNPFQYIR